MVVRLLSLIVLLSAFLFQPANATAESPLEYREALAETARAAEAALSALPATASLADYPPLRQALARVETLRTVTAGSTAVAVDNRSLARRFRGSRDEGRQALDSVRQLLRALDAATGKEDWAQDVDFRAELREVLARPEFRPAGANPVTAFLDDLRSRLFRWLDSLFGGVGVPQLPDVNLGRGPTVLFWALAGVMAAVTIVFFFFFVWRGSRRSLVRYAAVGAEGALEFEDARAAGLAAQRAAERGDYRQAVHHLYLWAILCLVEQSRLRYDRSLTNREQLRALANEAEFAAPLGMVIDVFDRVWYGHAACTANDYGQFRSAVERIVRATT